ncbi:hypothetical protein BJ741DRAFT_714817 [Chytriomyces cf. hyalinus JEL632]|nr:hypothetical protein BJ741DRAFT_714817 [Chytriomyces cf. hyalinus JEL632]
MTSKTVVPRVSFIETRTSQTIMHVQMSPVTDEDLEDPFGSNEFYGTPTSETMAPWSIAREGSMNATSLLEKSPTATESSTSTNATLITLEPVSVIVLPRFIQENRSAVVWVIAGVHLALVVGLVTYACMNPSVMRNALTELNMFLIAIIWISAQGAFFVFFAVFLKHRKEYPSLAPIKNP